MIQSPKSFKVIAKYSCWEAGDLVAIQALKKTDKFIQDHKAAQSSAAKDHSSEDTTVVLDPQISVGFIASKKVGGAVLRNRAKRRLRVLAAVYLPKFGRVGWNYVIIARTKTPQANWQQLCDEVCLLLKKVHKRADRKARY